MLTPKVYSQSKTCYDKYGDGKEITKSTEIFRGDMYKFIKDLDPKKVRDSDGISCYVLKDCAETLKKPLVMLCKNTVEEILMSLEWKRAKVVLVFKQVDEDALTHRSVSMTSTGCKSLEKDWKANG